MKSLEELRIIIYACNYIEKLNTKKSDMSKIRYHTQNTPTIAHQQQKN